MPGLTSAVSNRPWSYSSGFTVRLCGYVHGSYSRTRIRAKHKIRTRLFGCQCVHSVSGISETPHRLNPHRIRFTEVTAKDIENWRGHDELLGQTEQQRGQEYYYSKFLN